MIRINQIKLSPDHSEQEMLKAIRKNLKLDDSSEFEYRIVKRSVDSRYKPEVFFVYSVNVKLKNPSDENRTLKKVNNNNIMSIKEVKYNFPIPNSEVSISKRPRPVITGFGPAGMFCALLLARCGLSPIVIERGGAVEDRKEAVSLLWETGTLDKESNVQFGEGGAGTFSDGKLNTMVKDKSGRIEKVLETFVEFGADESILYSNKPHIGTDILCDVVRNMREEIIRLGGEIRFNTCLKNINVDNGRLRSIVVASKADEKITEEIIACEKLVLAIGHSARDTFSMINSKGVIMSPKSFAVGLRIEHPQEFINQNAYAGAVYKNLPQADYKVTAQTNEGRGVYSFCMCPGGHVVDASSEDGMLAVNGMSYSKRDSSNANSAIIVTVTPEDFGGDGPLAGVEFQRKLEKAAYEECNGKIPVQLVSDFRANRVSDSFGRVTPCIKGRYEFGNLRNVVPEFIASTILEGLEGFDNLIKGFNMPDAVLSGIESRTSSPVRINRNEECESSIAGLYPCGEGAGYAGGITSAAIDGIKIAENVASGYKISD